MQDYGNRTFDEIEIGASATATRTLTATDVEALALAAGDVEGLHIEGYDPNERLTAQGAAAIAMIAGLLNRRLPGPGAGEMLERRVKPLAEKVDCKWVEECDVTKDDQIARVAESAAKHFGKIDIVVHSIAFEQAVRS